MKKIRTKNKILSIFTLVIVLFTQFLPIVSYAEFEEEPFVDRYTYNFYNKIEGSEDNSILNTQIIKEGEKLTNPGTPSGEGIFLGWYDGETEVSFDTEITVTGTNTISIYPKYDTTQVTVTFIALGEVVDVRKQTIGEKVNFLDLVVPPKEGYQCAGWTIDSNPTADSDPFDENTLLTADLTLYLIYVDNYRVILDTNGGEHLVPIYVKIGSNLVDKLTEAPVKPGYNFVHWSKSKDNTTGQYDLNLPINEPITLYAIWERGEASYTVQYWLENADDDGYSYDSKEIKTGYTEDEATYDENKTFDGFHLNTIKTAAAAENINGNGTTIRNVYFSRNVYTLTFKYKNTWDGPLKTIEPSFQYKYGENTEENWNSVSTTYSDYSWAVENYSYWDSPKYFYSEAPRMPKENLTVYGVKLGDTQYRIEYRENISGNPEIKDAYNFKGNSNMNISDEDKIEIEGFTYASYTNFKKDGNVRVAKIYYDRITYQIDFYTYTEQDGVVSSYYPYEDPISGLATYSEDINNPTIREEDGYIFDGWYTDPGLNNKFDFTEQTMPARNMVLYAKWNRPIVNIIVHKNMYGLSGPTISAQLYKGQKIEEAYPDIEGFKNDYLQYNVPEGATDPTDFICWFWLIEGELQPLAYDFNINYDIHVYPAWKDLTGRIYYDAGEGEGTQEDPQLYVVGTNAVVMDNTFTAENMNFIYYAILDENNNEIERYYPGDYIRLNSTAGITLTAMWKNKVTRPTSVTYDGGDGGTFMENGTTKTQYSIGCTNNQVITVEANKFSKPNYRFTHYVAEIWDGTEYVLTEIQPNTLLAVTDLNPEKNILIAQWEINLVDVKLTKTWGNGPVRASDDIKVHLFRIDSNNVRTEITDKEVTVNAISTHKFEYTFEDLAKYESETGFKYVYEVEEEIVNEDIKNQYTSGEITEPTENNFTVTNTMKDEYALTDVKLTKTWGNGPVRLGSDIKVEVYRTGADGIKNKVEGITSTVNPTTPGLQFTYTFTDLAKYESGTGYKYIYELKEEIVNEDIKNHYISGEITEPTENNFTVTNTMKDEYALTDITLIKTWGNGPVRASDDIKVHLYRIDSNNVRIEITDKEVTVNAISTHKFEYVFEDLLKYESGTGYEYVYEVEEEIVNDDIKNQYTLGNIEGTVEDGFIVTNKYTSLQRSIKGNKLWVKSEEIIKPKVYFELYRKLEGQEDWEEKFVTKVEVIDNVADFGMQDLTDINGVNYIYSIKEKFENEDEAKNWDIIIEGFKITNCPKQVIPDQGGGQGGDPEPDVLPNTGNIRLIDKLFTLLIISMLIGITGIVFILKDKREREAYKYVYRRIY